MSLKRISARLFSVFALLLFAGRAVPAGPPTLLPVSPEHTEQFSQEAHPGQTKTFDLVYTQPQGDPPTKLDLVMETPGGAVTVHAPLPGGDPVKGIPVTWSYPLENSGTYRFHFEATSSTGGFVRFPAAVGDDFEFVSVSPITKYVTLAIGLVIALLFLPFVVYVAARSLNRRGDPAAAARIALLIGILAFCGLSWYLFLRGGEYQAIGTVIEILAAGAFLIVLFMRRPARH